MFTPELASDERGEFVLVANHAVETEAAVAVSVAFNRARIEAGWNHLPEHFQTCVLVYDIRGQTVADHLIASLEEAFAGLAELRIKRS